MKILFVTHYSEMYGANKSLCQLILELKNNYSITPIVLLRNSGQICDFLVENNIKFYVINHYWWVNYNRGLFQYFLNWRKQILNLFFLKKTKNIIIDNQIDLIYSNSITSNFGALISFSNNLPHIWHIREELLQYNLKFSWGKFYAKFFLQLTTDKYIFISKYLIDKYKDLIPLYKSTMIYNGVNNSDVNYIPKILNEEINFCMVGIVNKQKNNIEAIKAFDILVNKKKYCNIKLHLIGVVNTNYEKELLDFIDSRRLKSYIVFHGHSNNVKGLLPYMHIGLMCSEGEAFGRVTVEYMLNGIPVIASNSGANPELIIDGENGFIYQINDFEKLASKIEFFLENRDYINKIGKNAFEYANSRFTSKLNTEKVYEVIVNVLKLSN